MSISTVSTNQSHPRSSWFPWRHAKGSVAHPALEAAEDCRTFGERVADQIASFGGSWPFIFIFLGLIATWMIINTVIIQHLLNHRAFDPYPYIALNLVLSGLAGIQAPIIMMSQNRAAARDEVLASHHYDETHKLDDLLQSNTEMTQQVHELTKKIHELAAQIAQHTPGAQPASPHPKS